jgi:hypothetical protein
VIRIFIIKQYFQYFSRSFKREFLKIALNSIKSIPFELLFAEVYFLFVLARLCLNIKLQKVMIDSEIVLVSNQLAHVRLLLLQKFESATSLSYFSFLDHSRVSVIFISCS